MFDFPHSTFCHRFVESIFQQCFVVQPADIILTILKQANLPTQIIEAEKDCEILVSNRKLPLQYMPFLRSLAYALQKILTIANDQPLIDHIELCPGWGQYSIYITKLKDRKIDLSNNMEKPPIVLEDVSPVTENTDGLDYNPTEEPVNFDDVHDGDLDDMLKEFQDT